MTPVRLWPRRLAPATDRLVAAGLGLVLLAGLFIPARDPATQSLTIDWRPAAELVGLVFLVAIAAAIRPRAVAGRGPALALAILAAAAAALNLAAAATPVLLGRDLDLTGDVRHLPSLIGLAAGAAGWWHIIALAAVILGALLLATAGAYWAWGKVLAVLADRRWALAAAVVFGIALDAAAWAPPAARPLAVGPGRVLLRQVAAIGRGWHSPAKPGARYAAALATPAPPPSNLAGLKGRDVYLVYIESYGTAVFDKSEFRSAIKGVLAQFETTVRSAGYTIASNRLVSPAFGGGSWLAHATIASGVRLDDPVLYAALLASGRKLLPGYFKDAGWRAINIMPGIKTADPEAAAWDFDREIFAAALDYRGPAFGWFEIPDQFTLERTGAVRAALGPARPVFTQIVLVSSHIPFAPIPPYLADWSDAGTFAGVPSVRWDEFYRPPDWARLAPNYVESLQYEFTVLRDWLALRLHDDALVILLGDHQPPAAVAGGEDQPWTVPIHVLSRDAGLVAPFLAEGYVDGMVPTQAAPHPRMEEFLARFLAAFNRPGLKKTAADRRLEPP